MHNFPKSLTLRSDENSLVSCLPKIFYTKNLKNVKDIYTHISPIFLGASEPIC